MHKMTGTMAAALLALVLTSAASAEQQSGVVGSGAPEDLFLSVSFGADKSATISQSEFRLALGGYYRFNFECPAAGTENESGLAFTATELWQNSHLRLVSVSDPKSGFTTVPEINFHLQGLQIRMIECEGFEAAARFSFFPMRKGTYPFTVLNDTVTPPQQLTGSFIVE